MAAAVKATKALESVKQTTVITTYTSGAPVAPAAGTLAVYFDLASADEHRAVEMANKLKTLIDRAREINYGKPTATAYYLRCPLNGSKSSIVLTTDATDIVTGDVAIGVSATVRSGKSGSILFDSCFQQIIDRMFEQYGSADSAPTIAVNTGTSGAVGGTLPITSAMLRATSSRVPDAELAYTVTSGPLNGQLELTSDAGVAITTFTQGDINDGLLQYVHDGTATVTGAFVFSVSDGFIALTAQDFVVTVA
jgi:hypothetical protein